MLVLLICVVFLITGVFLLMTKAPPGAGEPERNWTWASIAPNEWFTDRTGGSVLVRGYVPARASVPDEARTDALWAFDFKGRGIVVAVRRGAFDVPRPVEWRYVGEKGLAPFGVGEVMRVPQGTYVVLMTPVAAPLRDVDWTLEREAVARLDEAAGLVAALLSPNAVFLVAFEFFQAAVGPEVHVVGPPVRNAAQSPIAALTEASLRTVKTAFDAAAAIPRDKLRRRITLSLRWYASAHAERNRVDSFVKFWIALEALTMVQGSPRELVEAIAVAYGREKKWADETFAINALAVLRNDIVHAGQQPKLHGNILVLTAALYEDALLAKLGLPAEYRAQRALPDGNPFRLGRWRDSGDMVTVLAVAGEK